jgi:hypothetical protein
MTKKKETKTVKINLTINADLEKEFREAISMKYGYKKGNLQLAIEEAVKDWIEKQNLS